MKVVLSLIGIVVLAIIVSLFGRLVFGYVLIVVGNYRIDLSLISAIILMLTVHIVIYILIRFFISLNNIPVKIKHWQKNKVLYKNQKNLDIAAIHYIEGKYSHSYKNAILSVNKNLDKENKFLALILAYKSAGFMRNCEDEQNLSSILDSYIDKKWQLAKLMVYAQSQYLEQKYGLCLDNLNLIIQLDKKHVSAREILLKVYLNLSNYEKAYEVLSWLLKNACLDKAQSENYLLRVLNGIFSTSNNVEQLTQIYQKLDNQDKLLINKAYLKGLTRLKEFKLAINFTKDMHDTELGFDIGDSLLILAKKLDNENDARQLLVIYEKYLQQNKQNSQLLLASGVLSHTLQLWDIARWYLESSLFLRPSVDGYIYLALVARAVGNQQLANLAEQNLLENIHNLV